jgi:hypothetical protein
MWDGHYDTWSFLYFALCCCVQACIQTLWPTTMELYLEQCARDQNNEHIVARSHLTMPRLCDPTDLCKFSARSWCIFQKGKQTAQTRIQGFDSLTIAESESLQPTPTLFR